ncbi:MAG: hypothetical protein GXO80_10270 [Chlorobi bacterium]|nr:hypothetical protein [Chlorobiota bacterium]
MVYKLPFGLKNGQLVEVKDVERGLECDCYCPACNSRLIARKGSERIEHFAHYKNPECEYAFETALHLAAKEIFLKNKKIKLPEFRSEIPGFGEQKIRDSIDFEYLNVFSEKKTNDIIPDLILEIEKKGKRRRIFIEIAVTHFIDEIKLEKIRKIGISTIEIDLSKEFKRYVDFKFLEELLINQTENKKWIFNAKKTQLINKKKTELQREKEEKIASEKEQQKSLEKAMQKLLEERKRTEITQKNDEKENQFQYDKFEILAEEKRKNEERKQQEEYEKGLKEFEKEFGPLANSLKTIKQVKNLQFVLDCPLHKKEPNLELGINVPFANFMFDCPNCPNLYARFDTNHIICTK